MQDVIWKVSNAQNYNVERETEEGFFGANFIDYKFFNYYLRDLINTDTSLIPKKIDFYLDKEHYSMAYIMDAFHYFMEKLPREFYNIEVEFKGQNKVLVHTYENLIQNMKVSLVV